MKLSLSARGLCDADNTTPLLVQPCYSGLLDGVNSLVRYMVTPAERELIMVSSAQRSCLHMYMPYDASCATRARLMLQWVLPATLPGAAQGASLPSAAAWLHLGGSLSWVRPAAPPTAWPPPATALEHLLGLAPPAEQMPVTRAQKEPFWVIFCRKSPMACACSAPPAPPATWPWPFNKSSGASA